jgi:hypothetical protein
LIFPSHLSLYHQNGFLHSSFSIEMLHAMLNVVVLTFHPELVDTSVHLSRLEAHTERREHQDGHEKHFPGVTMQETAELKQLALEARPQPQSCSLPGRFTLQQYGD